MFNTSYCRCKALLKLSQSAISTDLSHKVDLRSYASKVIYSSGSPHEKTHKHETYDDDELDTTLKRPSFEYRPVENKQFSQQEPQKKSYSPRDKSYEVKHKKRYPAETNTLIEKKKPAPPVQLFDTNYTFLDNTEKIRIKPRSPIVEDEDLKPDKLYKRNYKIIDNPSYSRELSYQQNKEDEKSTQSKNDHENDTISHNYSTRQLKKKYSFDSNLEFKNDADNVSPLKLDIINAIPNTNEDVTTCTVKQTDVTPNTDGTLTPTDLRPRYKTIDTPEGQITINLADDEFDMKDFIKEFDEQLAKPLDECTEDISYFGPDFAPTFNFAAYADKSALIQQFVKLGVKLYKVEKNMDHMRALLSVDLEKELPLYIQFLHDCGVPANCLGDAITENPMILKEDLDDMRTRIRYLMAHNFKPDSIARIITKNPSWLVWATKFIDERLGHFQNEFKLGGSDVRFLATKAPKLITYPMRHVNENTFAVREQMGFDKLETKLLLLYKPRLWMNSEWLDSIIIQ